MGAWRRRALRIVAALCLLLPAGCGQLRGAAPPAGCGPRPVRAPRAGAIPASPAAAGSPLPVWGPDVLAVAARGSLLFASSFNAPGGGTLFASTDGGASWTAAAAPPLPAGAALARLGLSPDGATLAGLASGHLWLGRLGSSGIAWTPTAPVNVFSFAFDPEDASRLVAVGGSAGPRGTATLWASADGGRTWSSTPLPVHPGAAAAGIAFWRGAVAVALPAYGRAPAAFLVPARGAPSALPAPPLGAGTTVSGLSAGTGGGLDLVAGGAVFALAAPGAAWSSVPLPTREPAEAWLPWGTATALLTYGGSTPGGQSPGWRLWVAPAPSGPWRGEALPGMGIRSPVADGTALWLAGSLGPIRAAAGGGVSLRARGLPAPVSVVASAAWRPTTVVAGWSGGLFASTDGGRSFAPRTPPGDAADDIASLRLSPDGRCLVLLYSQEDAFRGQPAAWLSGDLGRTWTPVAGLPGGAQPYSLAEWPAGSGIWWAALGGAHAGVYRSEPGAWIWRRVPLPAAAGPRQLHAAPGGLWLQAPATGGPALVLGPAGARGGPAAWVRRARLRLAAALVRAGIPAWGPPVRARAVWGAGPGPLAPDPYAGAVVYAGLRRSLDGGSSWSLVISGSSGWSPLAAARGYAFDPGLPGAAVASGTALYRDGGTAWTAFWTAGPGEFVTGIAGAGGDGFYAAVQGLGLIVARDPGASFHAAAPAAVPGAWITPAGTPRLPPLEAAAPSAPGLVYRVVGDDAIAVSHDGGGTWGTPRPIRLGDGTPCCFPDAAGPRVLPQALLVSPDAAATLYLGLALDEPTYRPTAGLWISRDGGRTWQRSAFPAALNVMGLAAAAGPGGEDVFAAAATTAGPGAATLWRSADGGRTWSSVPAPGPVYAIAAAPGNRLLAGSADAVLVSADGGASWHRFPVGLPQWAPRLSGSPGGAPVDAVLQAPDGWLYAGSGAGGLALSRDGGRTWQDAAMPVGDPPVRPGGLSPGAGNSVRVVTNEGVFVFRPDGS